MKKMAAVLVLALMCVCLGSCFVIGPGGTGEKEENLIYDSTTDVYLVYDPTAISETNVNLVIDKFAGVGINIKPRSKDSEAMEHEIVIGNVGRKVSDAAYVQLDRIDKNGENDYRYCVYSDGASVAVAFDEDQYGFTCDAAVEYFAENYVKSKLVLEQGSAAKVSFDLYEYLSDKDEVSYAKYWESVSSKAGESGADIVSALQYLYSIYDGAGLVSWFANLYDPDICVCKSLYGESECSNTQWCHTGGFYFSNSARNTVGFLPDAESTRQTVTFIEESGILTGVGSNYSDLLPDDVDTAIKNFCYNLQDPDGYFYHPQWGKAIGTSRRARDYNWCIDILSDYGVTPKYKTIADVPTDVSAELLPSRMGTSSVTAVSKVVLAESETLIPEHLQSVENFKKYLIELDIPGNSYSAGNTLSSQSSQIRARGEEYGRVLIEHLNSCQNANGTWHHTLGYDAVNGVMKISGVYSGFKAAIPNAKAACLASFAAISSDEEVGSIVDIWNAWEAFDRVMTNIKNFGESGLDEEIRNEILPDAADAIRATRDKLTVFRISDGSFIYQASRKTSGISMGAQVSVTGTEEGDVNATVIGTTNMVSSIFHCLKLGKAVPLTLVKERVIFLDILSEVKAVNKSGTLDEEPSPITFDYYEEGEVPTELRIYSKGNSRIVNDDRDEESKVFLFNSIEGSGDYFKINTSGYKTSAAGMVFESDFCFDSSSSRNNSLLRLEMGADGDTDNVYRIVFGTTESGVDISEQSSSSSSKNVTNHLASVEYGQWFNLKVIYYKGDHNTVRIKVFLDGKLLAVSDNYYDKDGVKLSGEGRPNTDLSECRFYVLKNYVLDLYLDNIRSYYTKQTYQYEPLHEDYRYLPDALDVDAISDDGVSYGFEDMAPGENYPENLIVNKGDGTASVVSSEDGNMLSLGGGASAIIPSVKRTKTVNSDSVSLDLLANGFSSEDAVSIRFTDRNTGNAEIFTLTVKTVTDGDKTCLAVYDSTGEAVEGIKAPVDEKITLTVDYYAKESLAIVYINGEKCGMVYVKGKANLTFGKAVITASGSGSILIDNLSAERTLKDFESATAPKYDGKIYDFTDGIDSGITVNGNGISAEDADGDTKLKFVGSASSSSAVKIPILERDDILSFTELSFDINFLDWKKDGVSRRIAFTDTDGNVIVSFALVISDGKVGVAEATALGIHYPMTEFDPADGANLRFEFYERRGITKVFVNGEFAFASALCYSADNASLTPAYTVISSGDIGGVVLLDNIISDRFDRLYIANETSGNKENGASTLTFNYSNGTSYPSGIITDINSGAPKPGVVEALRNGGADKVLKFESAANSSGMDELIFSVTESVENELSYVFEADFAVMEHSGSSGFLQLQLRSSGDEMIEITFTVKDGHVSIYQKNYATGSNGEEILVSDLGEWFNLRVEYYVVEEDGAREARTKVYVDGTEVFVSDLLYKDVTEAASPIDSVALKITKKPSGVLYVDNVSLKESLEEYDGKDVSYVAE